MGIELEVILEVWFRSSAAEVSAPKDRPQAEGLVELHLVLEPSPVIYKIYDGYWFFGGPTLGDLRQDLGAVTRKCRPDWDITTPELRAAWRSSFVSIKSAADRYQSTMDALPWVAHPHAMECRQERTAMENELSRLVNALPGLVWTALPDGLFDFLNERWLEYTGHSAIRTPAAMNAQQVMRNL